MNSCDTIRLRIKRQDAPDAPFHWEEFKVLRLPRMNITSCLQAIQRNPCTCDGHAVPPVAFESACLEEVCGSCTMLINGRVRQACSALVDELLLEAPVITLEPMTVFPVKRDLIVDRSRIFQDLKQVKAWVPIDGTYDLGSAPRQPEQMSQMRYRLSTCMSCGCCLEACPNYTADNSFMGAAILSQVRLMNAHPTGAMNKAERLQVVMGEGGITDCGSAQNCAAACPKAIPLTESIADIGRQSTFQAIRNWLG